MTYLLQLTSAQDIPTLDNNLLLTILNISNTQYDRAMRYINEYNEANTLLLGVSSNLNSNFQSILNMTNVQNFLNGVQSYLNDNVNQLITKYSPASVSAYIMGVYINFSTDLRFYGNMTQQYNEMYVLYGGKLSNFTEASKCLAQFTDQYQPIYRSAIQNFTTLMTEEIGSTVTGLDVMSTEIRSSIVALVGSLTGVIANPITARLGFDNFVSRVYEIKLSIPLSNSIKQITSEGPTLLTTVTGWVTKFASLMSETQRDIKSGSTNLDGIRQKRTAELIEAVKTCLNKIA